MNPLPRAMAIHDLSGIGKCSLTVVLPILSTMGVEVAALPTAILSTHTGDIVGYTYRDLTDDIMPIATHWQSLGLKFDALYSGWLSSARQNDIVSAIFDTFAAPHTLRLVDPVMGDHGRLYSTYTPDRVKKMAELCRRADIITPNLTEACFLLGERFREEHLSEEEACTLCRRLTELGPDRVIITGISTSPETIGAACWDGPAGRQYMHSTPKIPGTWHGTGDIFCSVLLGGILASLSLNDAAALAASFTHDCIARTCERGTDPRFGVDFEHGLPSLITRLKQASRARKGANQWMNTSASS